VELVEKSLVSDAPYWAWVKNLHIDGRPFDLEGRAYQLEIMRPVCEDGKIKQREVIRKGSQIGVTMGKVIEISHGAIHGLYPQGVIYYFPSNKAVEHFSKTRFKPFINDNEDIKSQVNDIDAVAVRRIGSVNVNFFGCSPTIRIGGEAKDSTSVRSTPADWVLLDERDLFDDAMARQVNQRLGNSLISRRSDIGTPKLPDDGVDLLYGKSDMRRWQIKCECGKFTCMESEFPDCISAAGRPVCIHCGREINRSNGKWVPDSPGKDVVGYWVSQLLNPNRDLLQVLREYEDPEAYDLSEGEFQRTVLGLPYVSSQDQLLESDVYACCTGDQMAYAHKGPCAAGVDVGKMLHVVIGHRIVGGRFRMVRCARVPNWEALHDLEKRYNVKISVIDREPEYHKGREYQQAEEHTVYLCDYSEHLKTFDRWNENEKLVVVNRTEIFDATHRITTEPGKLLIPRKNEEIKIFAHQMTRAVKVLEEDGRTGGKIFRYRKVGDKQDHYRNALNYFYLACKKIGIPSSHSGKKRPVTQDMTYKLGA